MDFSSRTDLRVFALMTVTALQLLYIVPDQKIKHTIAIRTAKTAVLHKFLIGHAACRTYYLLELAVLFLRLLTAQKSGDQLRQRKLSIKNCGVSTKIHLFGTLGTEMMLRPHTIDNFHILNTCFPDLTSLT